MLTVFEAEATAMTLGLAIRDKTTFELCTMRDRNDSLALLPIIEKQTGGSSEGLRQYRTRCIEVKVIPRPQSSTRSVSLLRHTPFLFV